jgi:transcriptional regulator with XRE-family HTH domain
MRISGKRIRQLRYLYQISQADLACEIDVEQKTISKLESDKGKNTGFCIVYKLAKFFNVTIESLIE